jgi:putative nucleotidyltransferase with HDIG domain
VLSASAANSDLRPEGGATLLAAPARGEKGDQLHQFAESLGNAVDARDSDTFHHSWEVAELSRLIAEALGLPESQVETVHLAGHLHDIGKIGIPDSILRKQGVLNSDEWALMKRHPDIGSDIIRPIEAFASRGGVTDMVHFHHERFDGTGYPRGLKGYLIPLGARIIAVADTLSALLQNRPYRSGTTFEAAMGEIKRCAGTQFDPAVVLALEAIAGQVREFFQDRLSGGALPALGDAPGGQAGELTSSAASSRAFLGAAPPASLLK